MSELEKCKLSKEELKAKISTWQNRAYMAQQQANHDLVKQALEQKRKYEKLLAVLGAGIET